MKKKNSRLSKLRIMQIYLIPLFIAAMVICVFGLRFDTVLFGISGAAVLAVGAVTFLIVMMECRKLQIEVDALYSQNDVASKAIFSEMAKPAVICTRQGQVIMRNKPFEEISQDMYLNKVFTSDELAFSHNEFEKKIGDRTFIANVTPIETRTDNARDLIFIMLTDISLQVKFSQMYEQTKPVVVKIFVDNYDNLTIENDLNKSTIFNKIEERILHLTNTVTMGIYRRENRSFLMVFETLYLPAFEDALTGFLHNIHEIKNSDGKDISLSVGVGAESNIDTAAMLASEALEMALGRGGDQAVVKRSKEASPKYYGDGKNNSDQAVSRVFVRNIASRLREHILDSTEVYIMGHADEDVDCYGSGLALASFIKNKLDKPAYYVCRGGLEQLTQSIATTVPDPLYMQVVSPEDILEEKKDGALLIIVDTQREVMLSSKELYRQLSNNCVVIDHHRRSEDVIKNLRVSFMESTVSSASEMVTELLQNLSEERKPIPKFEATVLFAGIAMDTKGFIFNTGRRTFEAAALLKKCGAESTAALMMYQDDKKRYEAIAAIVSKATVYPNKIAVAVCDTPIEDTRAIIARAADSLVALKDIAASIVIAQIGDNAVISARSMGAINVQLICEKLGGGGHRTVAGAQLANTRCDDALEQVNAAINMYYKEKEKKENESDTAE